MTRLDILREQGFRRLAVTFVNHGGLPLVKGVPMERAATAAAEGLGFSPVSDAFGATGAIDPLQSLAVPDGDLRLRPDLSRLAVLDRDLGWAWAPGDRLHRDGGPYGIDQRLFCRRQLQALERAGVTMRAGFEIEWMVGRSRVGDGHFEAAFAGGPYGADRLIDGLEVLTELAEALDAAGLAWHQLHPEYGPGQMELSLAPADALAAADDQVLARLVIRRVCRKMGLACSFSPLVAADLVGNGGHLHFSLERSGESLFGPGPGPGGLTALGGRVVAGLLHHLPALLPLACALGVSYRRLRPGSWAAPFGAWGIENREAALRLVPAGPDGVAAHLELKVADLSANPYLLMGAVAAAVREALGSSRPLPEPVVGDPARLESPPARLPQTLDEATGALEGSETLREAMGEPLHRTVIESRRAEVRRVAGLDEGRLIASTRWWPIGMGV